MSDDSQWKKPRYIDPARLDNAPDSAARHLGYPPRSPAEDQRPYAGNPIPPQEFPLEQVTIEPDETDQPVTTEAPQKRGLWRKVFAYSATAVLVTGVGLELYRLLDWGFSTHIALGSTLAALLSLAAGSGALQLWRSLKGLRQLRRTEELQAQAARLGEQSGQGQAAAFLRRLEQQYRNQPGQRDIADAIRDLDSAYSDSEVVEYLSRHLFLEQDARARRCVQRYSVESGVLVALSPWASFDMLLVGWRNLRMLREVAAIYGIAPGAATQWALLKRVMHSLAFAGLSEMAMDAGSTALSGSLTASLSARAGQGLGAGLFTARTGLEAIRRCRPIPSEQRDRKVLKAVTEGIVQRLSPASGKG
ncbi:TIGR01620 family protein [Marinobacterium litorale]|uniref:TIGR01620 family protein n=1 Tax=Marinobacterium litorale TaxID=404770 RepID=UPI0004185DFE|nr:TIGR01620 family protein [Marinobacterium litorale]